MHTNEEINSPDLNSNIDSGKYNKKLLNKKWYFSSIVILLIVVFILLIITNKSKVPTHQELSSVAITPTSHEINDPETPSALTSYFHGKFIAAINSRELTPIDKFNPKVIIDTLPGIKEEDFNGVLAKFGSYQFTNGQLVLNTYTPIIGSDDYFNDALTMDGFKKLLKNLSVRFGISLIDEKSVDSIMSKVKSQSPEPTINANYFWKEFNNSKLSYVVSYPNTWVADLPAYSNDFTIKSNDYLIDNTEYPSIIDGSSITIRVDKTKYLSGEEAFKADSITFQTSKAVKNTVVDGQPALQSDWGWEGQTGQVTYFVKNGYLYTITLNGEYDQEKQEIYQKLLESLKSR